MSQRYIIDSAIIETAGHPGTLLQGRKVSPAPAWDLVYSDRVEFEAADDADAIDHAESLQRRHDGAYRMLCYGLEPAGMAHAPRYLDRLFKVADSGLEPVLP